MNHNEKSGSGGVISEKPVRVLLRISSDMKDMRAFKLLVADKAQAMRPKTWPMDAGMHLTIEIGLERPKSLPKKVVLSIKRPAADKLLDAIVAGLTGIFFIDGSQIVSVTIIKKYWSRRLRRSSSARIDVDAVPAHRVMRGGDE